MIDIEFISYDPMSRYQKEDRSGIRDFRLRGNRIAVTVEDYDIDLDVLSARAGVGRDVIHGVMHGHTLDVDEVTVLRIEAAVTGILDGAAWKSLCDDLLNYGTPDGRILEMIRVFVELNDDIYHARHADIIRGSTARIRAVLDKIDASPDLECGVLHGGGE